jgi:hypothetical protein
MKAKLIFTCLFLMAMFTVVTVRGQTTSATAYSFDYGLLYPAPNDSRLTGSVPPHVLIEPKTGKIAYSVRADSTELDSLALGYQRAWSLEVRRIVSNTANLYSDSVEFRKRETGYQGAVSYKDTTIFIYQNKTLLLDIWPGIDIMFYDGDSMAVRDIMLIYLVNREYIKTHDGNIITLPMDRFDTLTVADFDTLSGVGDTIFTRAFPISRHFDVGAFIDIVPITSTGDTLTLAVQTKLNGSGWYGGPGRSGRIIKSPVAFFDSTYHLTIPADSIGLADSARVAQIAEVNKGRNIIKRFKVKFWK